MTSPGARRWALSVLLVGLSLTALVALAGCSSAERPSIVGQPVALPTPLRSFPPSVAATVGELRNAVGEAGYRLDPPVAAYRPSEPQSLISAPRVILRASLADPDEGFVVVYPFADQAIAREQAGALAAYLGSGFGQTNYPPDAQFSVGLLADTVVFTWWSRARSSDPARAEAVYDAVRSVGEPVEVLK